MNFSKNNYCNKYLNLDRAIMNICNFENKYFLNKKWVVGVALGYKVRGGFYTCQKCIKVFVIKKVPICRLCTKDIIPRKFKGITTDVVETGMFTICSLRKKIRPVKGGYNVGCGCNLIDGTAGCLVTNGIRNFVLSSNHVLAGGNLAPLGSFIIQPACKYHGKVPKDAIANLSKFIPIRYIEGEEEPTNLSDCAIAELTDPHILSPEIALLGNLNCVKNARLNELVKKVGSETELTEGTVLDLGATIIVSFGSTGKRAKFSDVIVTTRMSELGDSGSILVNKNKCAIGMLFTQSNNGSGYCSLNTVLSQLEVTLVTG